MKYIKKQSVVCGRVEEAFMLFSIHLLLLRQLVTVSDYHPIWNEDTLNKVTKMSVINISNCLPLFEDGGYLWLRTAEVYNGFKLNTNND